MIGKLTVLPLLSLIAAKLPVICTKSPSNVQFGFRLSVQMRAWHNWLVMISKRIDFITRHTASNALICNYLRHAKERLSGWLKGGTRFCFP